MIRLADIRDSFEGVIPSIVATTDADGIPNVSYLSHVYYVDERHVALSNQFFSKTAANVRANGLATVMVVDGRTGAQHVLDLTFETSVDGGPLFDRVASHLAVVSTEQGMGDIMKLKALDIYRVKDVHAAPAADSPGLATHPRDHLSLAADLALEIGAETDAEGMLDRTLAGLEQQFGYRNTMILVPDEGGHKLSTLASRGYGHLGIGAETEAGRGTIGMAARSRRPVRISDLRRSRRYVSAVKAATMGEAVDTIPFPALRRPLSQLAVPMLARGRLLGVLFAESEESFAFGHKDEAALQIVAGQLATGLLLAEGDRSDHDDTAAQSTGMPADMPGNRIAIRFYARDGSLFVNGDYLIRGVPGRLLHHFLQEYLATGRTAFSNRELRRTRSLTLPDVKDNLETRLILLRRRLEEKNGPIRLLRPDRGRILLCVSGPADVEVMED